MDQGLGLEISGLGLELSSLGMFGSKRFSTAFCFYKVLQSCGFELQVRCPINPSP